MPDRNCLAIGTKILIDLRQTTMLTLIVDRIAGSMAQRITGSRELGIVPAAMLVTGSKLLVGSRNVPVGLALIGTASHSISTVSSRARFLWIEGNGLALTLKNRIGERGKRY
jgi:hypothetical protein